MNLVELHWNFLNRGSVEADLPTGKQVSKLFPSMTMIDRLHLSLLVILKLSSSNL